MSKQFLVVQTAFLGDVILTLPLVQILKKVYPDCDIDVVIIPSVRNVLDNHPSIREAIVFDKRGRDNGIWGIWRVAKVLQKKKYNVAFVPHRSLRSAILVLLAGIEKRIGFDTSAGRILFHEQVHYDSSAHEVKRNLALLAPLGIQWQETEFPSLFPSESDKVVVERLLSESAINHLKPIIAIAPGTRWNTKRWLKERFAELLSKLSHHGFSIALIGGTDDVTLCEEIVSLAGTPKVIFSAGKLSILQSAELIKRCAVLVTNDSAPMHIAVAVRTPVVAIYGATVPEFGFAPYGERDIVVETKELKCRPCSIHGGNVCPIRTFDCMVNITANMVMEKVLSLVQ